MYEQVFKIPQRFFSSFYDYSIEKISQLLPDLINRPHQTDFSGNSPWLFLGNSSTTEPECMLFFIFLSPTVNESEASGNCKKDIY